MSKNKDEMKTSLSTGDFLKYLGRVVNVDRDSLYNLRKYGYIPGAATPLLDAKRGSVYDKEKALIALLALTLKGLGWHAYMVRHLIEAEYHGIISGNVGLIYLVGNDGLYLAIGEDPPGPEFVGFLATHTTSTTLSLVALRLHVEIAFLKANATSAVPLPGIPANLVDFMDKRAAQNGHKFGGGDDAA